MKHRTKGIVFSHIKFRETSIITNIYTELFGMKSYIVNGVRSKKPQYPIGLFQPMTQLDLIVYNKQHASINRIGELKGINIYRSIPYDIYKTTIILFISEILNKILREEEANTELYTFLENSLVVLDRMEKDFSSFHLHFLLRLLKYLGIEPEDTHQLIQQIEYSKPYFMPELNEKDFLKMFLESKMDQPVNLTSEKRKELLNIIILYYKNHFDQLSILRSYEVLREVFE